MNEIEKAKLKRDSARSRAYRRGGKRFVVYATEQGRLYRVNEEFRFWDYLARTCDEAMSIHVNMGRA
jgi:esterase/lipase superfamily enzyme